MRYTVRKSIINVLGDIWMPCVTASLQIVLRDYDIENIRDEDGIIDRDAVEQWLCSHSGDFRSVIDFYASIEDGDKTIDIPWLTEDNEMAYLDTLGSED